MHSIRIKIQKASHWISRNYVMQSQIKKKSNFKFHMLHTPKTCKELSNESTHGSLTKRVDYKEKHRERKS